MSKLKLGFYLSIYFAVFMMVSTLIFRTPDNWFSFVESYLKVGLIYGVSMVIFFSLLAAIKKRDPRLLFSSHFQLMISSSGKTVDRTRPETFDSVVLGLKTNKFRITSSDREKYCIEAVDYPSFPALGNMFKFEILEISPEQSTIEVHCSPRFSLTKSYDAKSAEIIKLILEFTD